MQKTNLCPLHKCTGCLVEQTSGRGGKARNREVRRLQEVVAEGTKSGSWDVQRRGLAHFVRYLEGKGGRLPAQEMDVSLWLVDCVKRDDRIDSTTAESYMAGVAAYHVQAGSATEGKVRNPTKGYAVRSVLKVVRKHYKLESKAQRPLSMAEWLGMWNRGFDLGEDSRKVKHARLAMVIATFGPFRAVAWRALKVTYKVRGGAVTFPPGSDVQIVRDGSWKGPYIMIKSIVDKNVDSSKVRKVPIPAVVMGVHTVRLLQDYLVSMRPPSGGYLLAAPVGQQKWSKAKFSSMGKLVKGAFARAFPGMPATGVAGNSFRKSWAQWMKRVSCTDSEVVDICGWSRTALLKATGTQVIYQKTEIDSQLLIKEQMQKRLNKVQRKMEVPAKVQRGLTKG